MTLDSQEYARQRVKQTRPLFDYAAQTFGDVEKWQASFRPSLLDVLGIRSDWERPPLFPQIQNVEQMDGYRRETITFTTRPGLTAFAYFLVPDHCPPNQPAVLCLPGHGRGVQSIVGIGPNGEQRGLHDGGEYAKDFALWCVREGYPTLALEQISFGHRRDAALPTEKPEMSSCQRDGMAALMVGETLIGWRVWDAFRALDYLQTRPEVNPDRLITMGISGGGLTSLFTAALDTRVWSGVVSCYLNTFADSVLAVSHCTDNYAPSLLTLCEMPDLAGLIAPRLLYAEGGESDPIFPHPAFEIARTCVSKIYEDTHAPQNFRAESFPGGHQFYGTGAFAFLSEHVNTTA